MNVYIPAGNITDMQGPCPSGFHIPSKDEWTKIYNIGVSLGIWDSSSGEGIKTYLKLPYAGRRNYSNASASGYFGGTGNYWCSGIDSIFRINSSSISIISSSYPSQGYSIRPFKDVPIEPDSGWTALYSDKIYHNSTLGLISITSDGVNWITIADKNLGATSTDTTSTASSGYYYQYGNNYGFPGADTATYNVTSISSVDASTYGPGNYYSSSTFITANPRDSSNNANLRGGETGLKINELKNAYIGEYKPNRGPCDEGFHVPSKDDASKLRTMYQSIVPSGSRDTSTQLLAPSLRKYFYAGSAGSGNTYPNNFIVTSNTFSSSYSHSYWTNTNYDIGNAYTMRVSVNNILNIDTGQNYKGYGYPIRPFKDTVVEPDSNWTVLYQGTGTAGIYHNSTLGLISLSSDGSDWITIADKDLGATSVNGSGNLYQRGNNYGFTYSAGTYNSGFGTTLVNASNYGPGNYYSNSQPTFAKTISSEFGWYWDSSNNANLRGGEEV